MYIFNWPPSLNRSLKTYKSHCKYGMFSLCSCMDRKRERERERREKCYRENKAGSKWSPFIHDVLEVTSVVEVEGEGELAKNEVWRKVGGEEGKLNWGNRRTRLAECGTEQNKLKSRVKEDVREKSTVDRGWCRSSKIKSTKVETLARHSFSAEDKTVKDPPFSREEFELLSPHLETRAFLPRLSLNKFFSDCILLQGSALIYDMLFFFTFSMWAQNRSANNMGWRLILPFTLRRTTETSLQDQGSSNVTFHWHWQVFMRRFALTLCGIYIEFCFSQLVPK